MNRIWNKDEEFEVRPEKGLSLGVRYPMNVSVPQAHCLPIALPGSQTQKSSGARQVTEVRECPHCLGTTRPEKDVPL